ncbi:MAG: hypothetical protein KGL40_13665 [Rhodocyclaceae bacterium]|nr:hypothetical protein [Rhodocyclaceae bacterium]
MAATGSFPSACPDTGTSNKPDDEFSGLQYIEDDLRLLFLSFDLKAELPWRGRCPAVWRGGVWRL